MIIKTINGGALAALLSLLSSHLFAFDNDKPVVDSWEMLEISSSSSENKKSVPDTPLDEEITSSDHNGTSSDDIIDPEQSCPRLLYSAGLLAKSLKSTPSSPALRPRGAPETIVKISFDRYWLKSCHREFKSWQSAKRIKKLLNKLALELLDTLPKDLSSSNIALKRAIAKGEEIIIWKGIHQRKNPHITWSVKGSGRTHD